MVEAAVLCTLEPCCPLSTRLSGSVSWCGQTGLNGVNLPGSVRLPTLMPLSQLLQDETSFFFPSLCGLAAENKIHSTFCTFREIWDWIMRSYLIFTNFLS